MGDGEKRGRDDGIDKRYDTITHAGKIDTEVILDVVKLIYYDDTFVV